MRIGSLCSGVGGLEMGLQAVVGGQVAWHAETDRHAATILAHRYPGVPNLGDLTDLTWADHPVDVLTAGFPCQPVSAAGKRRGVSDERWLFDAIVTGLGRMDPRPRLCVLENVLGLLSANGGHAMGRVVHGLASVGYVGRWRVIRAADAGAPHGRARVFIVATDAGIGQPLARAGAARDGLLVAAECGPVAAADPDIARPQGCEPAAGQHLPARSTSAAADGGGSARLAGSSAGREPLHGHERRDADRCGALVEWGDYEPAIRRWERILGRPAPRPTEPGRSGERLSPRLVEWMMGLPAGWVTDVPIPRNAQLKALGNGVVPQQAALALTWLLGDCEAVA